MRVACASGMPVAIREQSIDAGGRPVNPARCVNENHDNNRGTRILQGIRSLSILGAGLMAGALVLAGPAQAEYPDPIAKCVTSCPGARVAAPTR